LRLASCCAAHWNTLFRYCRTRNPSLPAIATWAGIVARKMDGQPILGRSASAALIEVNGGAADLSAVLRSDRGLPKILSNAAFPVFGRFATVCIIRADIGAKAGSIGTPTNYIIRHTI
jgi:hypothetical protein